ncbi:L-type lectin-domain containing receptor kinase IX.2-like [Phragmites australis]|uniref:L-type lectin-domain containing receptor kinase IX.2-like n=1 Tax=Phragmites australis TaxID=29695 RepID=UPI002D7794FE|nr:L-type lectin-domain containing receptor kinase IX.2-like [Phragmites australis]
MAAYPRAHLLVLAYLCLMPLHAAALSFDYDFSKPEHLNSPDLKFINDSSRAGDRINLTNGTEHNSTGRVFHQQPVRLWDGRKRASFTTRFSFAIGGNDTNRRGDGMAFFIGPAPLPWDSRSMFLGLFNNPNNPNAQPPETVGVEFDTNWNEGYDPPNTTDHIGIDVNNITSTKFQRVRSTGLYDTMSANITYSAGSKMMAVTLQLHDGSVYKVETEVDFREAGVPQDASVGFSAATGVLTESHQLLSWSFSSTDPSNTELLWAIWVAVAIASLAGLVVALVCIIITRGRGPMEIALPVARKFTYHELSTATKNFSRDRKLCAGSFGEVYRGELDPHKQPVAVKKLTLVLEQTRSDYVTEIMTLGQLSHRNLVKLVGWCDGGGNDKLLLAYELVTNGSLDKHLHGSVRLLTWPERYKIVLGIGYAIEYLHTLCKNTILHRDIKPSNVMLDGDFEAKLGDFGLVRQVDPGQNSLSGTIMFGSLGYMDPQCITKNTASTASDMYSFGVLLLEVATGKDPAVLWDELGSNTLVNAVRESDRRGAVLEMADERLNGDFDKRQMERVLVVGLRCVQLDREDRPEIRRAINWLSNLSDPVPQVLYS